MRRGRYQREVVERLTRIESNLDKICRELARVVERRETERPQADISGPAADKWLQEGIDNIMSFQAGKKREGEQ